MLKQLFAWVSYAIIAGLVIVSMFLGGCATIERHPVATAVIVGVAASSIAISLNGPEHRREWVYRTGVGPQVRP